MRTDVTGLESPESLKGQRPAYGLIHYLFALVGCLALYAGCFVSAAQAASRGDTLWAGYSALSGAVGGAILGAGVGFAGLHARGGLLQRVAVTSGLLWLACLAVRHIAH